MICRKSLWLQTQMEKCLPSPDVVISNSPTSHFFLPQQNAAFEEQNFFS